MHLACAKLFSWLEKGAAIVTPTPLLARVAGYQFSREQLLQGRESWERPPIQTIGAWLTARWQEARFSGFEVPVLLSPSQEHLLWRQIIEQRHPELFDIGATASLARRAANVVREWRIPAEGEEWIDHEDARQFQSWYSIFRRRCSDGGWMTRADLWDRLPRWIAEGRCGRDLTVFSAFQFTSPALERLIAALDGSGKLMPNDSGKAERGRAREFSGFDKEIENAARWSRAAFERRGSHSIGVFVPELSAHRRAIEYSFRQVFYPRSCVGGSYDPARAAFQIHSTPPLSERPLIAAALLLLKLARPSLNINDASAILRCPFVKGAEAERSARATADLKLCNRRRTDVDLRDLKYISAQCPQLTSVWRRVHRVLGDVGTNRTFAEWTRFFGDLLKAVGWPGKPADLNAEEQDLVDAWDENLSALASLELVSDSVPFEAALVQLTRGLASDSATPELAAPVQILEASAAAGLRFDSTLAIGLSDETWPPPNRPSPLIPLKLQRARGVPASDPRSAREQAERATRALFESAPSVSATYSGQLSALVKRFVHQEAAAPDVWQGRLPWQTFASADLDRIEDGQGPPFLSVEPAHGGTSVLKSQSLCPFRAFTEHRLHAVSPEDPCFGLDPRERGGFLHKALQFVWRDLQNSDRLLQTSQEELERIVEAGVNAAVSGPLHDSFYQLISVVERQRLKNLILEWLQVERARTQPFTVEILEEEREFSIPGLRLTLRVDRIDRLANGNILLIDYKSSAVSRQKLKCPRPPEPQLLIYAAAAGESVDGLLFAELRPGSTRPVGFTRERHFDSDSAEVVKNWRLFLDKSQAEVLRLSNDFIRGYAAVDPRSGACQYCRVSSICRVNELHAQEEAFD
jgi:probable DNA repair protein